MVIIEILIQVYHLLIPCFSMNDCNHYTSTSSISYVQHLKTCLLELAIQKWFKYDFPKHNKVQWKDGGANHLSTSKRFFLKNFSWKNLHLPSFWKYFAKDKKDTNKKEYFLFHYYARWCMTYMCSYFAIITGEQRRKIHILPFHISFSFAKFLGVYAY